MISLQRIKLRQRKPKRGDSLWIIAHQHGDLPTWLISQYNPDVDLGDIRPGTTITLPRIAAINRQ
jgi:hypothetical protein